MIRHILIVAKRKIECSRWYQFKIGSKIEQIVFCFLFSDGGENIPLETPRQRKARLKRLLLRLRLYKTEFLMRHLIWLHQSIMRHWLRTILYVVSAGWRELTLEKGLEKRERKKDRIHGVFCSLNRLREIALFDQSPRFRMVPIVFWIQLQMWSLSVTELGSEPRV